MRTRTNSSIFERTHSMPKLSKKAIYIKEYEAIVASQVKGLVVCDDAARITWVEMGWPGSVHDNRVWVNSDIYLSTDKYFDQKEYFLGDSAFLASAVMIPAFNKSHNSNLSEERRFFNNKLAKVRIKSKHCIGLLKAPFQHLCLYSS